MALPELDVARVQRWCAARVPEHARHQVRVECQVAPRQLTIIERRAPWRGDVGPEWTSFPIARLRYTVADNSWTLYWRDRNLRPPSAGLIAGVVYGIGHRPAGWHRRLPGISAGPRVLRSVPYAASAWRGGQPALGVV
jgi:hypothetical protein